MNVTGDFKRKLAGLERASMMMPNPSVILVGQVNKEISGHQFQEAVDKACVRHPWLRARVELDSGGTAWFTSIDVPKPTIQITGGDAPIQWRDIVLEMLKKPFDCEAGPLARFILIPSKDAATILVAAHHMICDGMSLYYLLRDFVGYVAEPGREVERLPVPLPLNQETIPVSLQGDLLERFFIKRIGKAWEKRNISFNKSDRQALQQVFWSRNRPDVLAWRIGREQTGAIISSCRQKGVSVNTALLAAFLMAQDEVQEPRPYLGNIIVSVDLRDRMLQNPGEAVGFYAAAIRPHLEVEKEMSFWELALKYQKVIDEMLTDKNIFASQRVQQLPPTLMDALTFQKYNLLNDNLVKRLLERTKRDRVNAGLLIANLGRVDSIQLETAMKLEAVYGPFVYTDTNEKYLGVITIDGHMHFALSFGETLIDRELVVQIKERAMGRLAASVF